MGARIVGRQDPICRRRLYRAPFQKVVDLFIGHAIDLFVRAQRRIGFEIGRRHLPHEVIRCAECGGHGADTPFVEAGKRKDVGGAVAELGVETHKRFGGVVGSDDEAGRSSGDRILRHHPLQ
jgi:hypothetical protein